MIGVVALAHRLGREVGVGTGAVPVALDRLGVERRGDAEVLGRAVEQPAGDPQLVGHLERAERADLELPLAGHDLGVDARRCRAPRRGSSRGAPRRSHGRRSRRRRRRSSSRPAGRGSRSVGKPSGRAPAKNVYSCSMPNSGSWPANCSATARAAARVLDGVRGHVGVEHLAQHQDVVAAPDRVRAGEHRLEHAVGRVRPRPGWCSSRRSPRSAGSAPSARIFVFDRSLAVGSVPSIQMYSALMVIDPS